MSGGESEKNSYGETNMFGISLFFGGSEIDRRDGFASMEDAITEAARQNINWINFGHWFPCESR